MATTTFLSNATVNITQGATTYDVTDQLSSAVLTVGYDQLESTAFTSSGSPTGHTWVAGLQTGELALSLYLSYGSTEVEDMIQACVGKTSMIVISPSGTTESASNPEYTLSAFLPEGPVINSNMGELATAELTFQISTWSRDNA